jgi:uncharacterized membrane protein YuzA (DUF378 family)
MIQETRATWTLNRTLAFILGVVFTILGLVGFFTSLENSTGVRAVLGIFDSDTFGNVFYLITGLLGLRQLLQDCLSCTTASSVSSIR